jgi:hypothetical protein
LYKIYTFAQHLLYKTELIISGSYFFAKKKMYSQLGLNTNTSIAAKAATTRAASQLLQFLTAQEISLTNHHRRDYFNVELRLLHHNCCSSFENLGAKLVVSTITSKQGAQQKPLVE